MKSVSVSVADLIDRINKLEIKVEQHDDTIKTVVDKLDVIEIENIETKDKIINLESVMQSVSSKIDDINRHRYIEFCKVVVISLLVFILVSLLFRFI